MLWRLVFLQQSNNTQSFPHQHHSLFLSLRKMQRVIVPECIVLKTSLYWGALQSSMAVFKVLTLQTSSINVTCFCIISYRFFFIKQNTVLIQVAL